MMGVPRLDEARRMLGAGLSLTLALGLFLTAFGGVRTTDAVDCRIADGREPAPGCEVSVVRPARIQAEAGDVWVSLAPAEVLIYGSTEGKAVYRGLLADGSETAEPAPNASGEQGNGGLRAAGLELARYTVQAGDTLSSIAERFKIDVSTLVQANSLARDAALSVGARLLVPPEIGVVHRVQAGDTLQALVERYAADFDKTARVNGLQSPYTLQIGQSVLLPGGKLPPPPPEPPKPEPQPARDAEAPQPGQALAASIELPPAPLPLPTSATPSRAAFILMAAEAARESQRQTGVPASVTIAQAILESDWGVSKLSKDYNNFFGIKGDRPGTAGVAWFDTWEVINGVSVVQHAAFRAYNRPADSFVDHGWFFIQNPRYGAAMAARKDPRQFAREINRAGYATDPDYAPKLIGLMDRYNLYAYDLP
jgi:flagellum-specific peptidoglycan hydrolase FlgJ